MNDSPWMPVLLGLLAGMCFGVSVVVARFGLFRADARTGSLVSIATTACAYWVLFPFFLHESVWTAPVLWRFVPLFALIGVFSPGLSLLLAFEGNRVLGPTLSATVASTAPLFAAIFAVALLGEQPSLPVVLGTLAIVAGVIVLSWRGRSVRDWRLGAVLALLGAAVIRGGVHIGSKVGFGLAEAPFTGALVTFSASFAVMAAAYQLSGRRLPVSELKRVAPWFVLTGLLNGVGLLATYSALSLGRVVVVSPMVSTYPLFTLGLASLLHFERASRRVLLGVVMVVAGVAAIAAR
jgi:drug/metabolite transporter (DMT)-like permease